VTVRFRPFPTRPDLQGAGLGQPRPSIFIRPRATTCGAISSASAPRFSQPFRRPDPFPQNSLLAARVAQVGLAQEWGEPFLPCRLPRRIRPRAAASVSRRVIGNVPRAPADFTWTGARSSPIADDKNAIAAGDRGGAAPTGFSAHRPSSPWTGETVLGQTIAWTTRSRGRSEHP